MIIEIILANNNKERYKISIKNKPSIKESELAIPNQLLKKIKIEKYKIVTKFWLIYIYIKFKAIFIKKFKYNITDLLFYFNNF